MAPLTPYQLGVNSRLNVGDSEGVVVQSDNHLTAIGREDGRVDWYTTEYVRDNATVVLTEAEQQQELTDAQRIAQLEQELAEAKTAQEAAPGPAATSEPTASVTEPDTTEATRQQTA